MSDSAIIPRIRTEPHLFQPHPHLGERVNHNIIQSEIEGGVFLDDLAPGALLEVETQNRTYRMEYRGDGQMLICGHPEFCPEAVLVHVHGSTWGGTMLKMCFIGRGMHLEFYHPEHGLIFTSRIQEIREVGRAAGGQSGVNPCAYRN